MKLKVPGLILSLLFSICTGLQAQQLYSGRNTFIAQADVYKDKIPLLVCAPEQLLSILPSRVDNSGNKYFPDIQKQQLATCQQFSGIYNAFSYEINRLRDVSANAPSTIYPPSYTYNLLNSSTIYGVSFYYSFDVLKTQGHPDLYHFGALEDETGLFWMSGYNHYLNAMQNRLHEVYRIPVNTVEGNRMMKNWLAHHLNNESTGGVAVFGCSNDGTVFIPSGQYEAGKIVLLKFGRAATHGLTITGYDDQVGYDINHDGIISDTLDINNDGIVDLKDWEKGAYIVANSYGADWGNNGFLYILYSAMAYNYSEGGVWNESCYVLEPYKEFQPKLSLKITLQHNLRNQLKIMAGISSDTSSADPEHIIDFINFRYNGGPHPMKGIESLPEPDIIEMGLDISPLLSYTEADKPCKIFLQISEMDPDGVGNGSILSYSVIDYTRIGKEFACKQSNVKLIDNGLTSLAVTIQPKYQKPKINPSNLNFTGNVPQQFQLEASGGEAPYSWTMPVNYICKHVNAELSSETGPELQLLNSEIPQNSVALPFKFPFCGGEYDTIYVNHTGFVAFESSEMPYNYTTDGENVLSSIKCIGAAHHELIINANYHRCWVKTNDSICEIQWKFEFTYLGKTSQIHCGLRLFQKGTFEIIYDTLPDVKSYPLAWGYSDGTDSKEFLSTIYNLSDYSKKAMQYYPDYVNDKLSISETGLLTLRKQDKSPQNDFLIRVTDKNLVSSDQNFILHQGTEIIDRANTGPNGIFEYNETCSIDCIIWNNTDNTLINPVLSINIDSTLVAIADTMLQLVSIGPGDSLCLMKVFSFKLKNKPPDRSFFRYTLLLVTKELSTSKNTEIYLGRPILKQKGFIINDCDDRALQPGEISACSLQLMNEGSIITQGLQCEIESDNPLLRVIPSEMIEISDISAGSQRELKFFLQADKSTEFGTECNLLIKLNNNNALDTTFIIHLELNRRPVFIINISPNSHTADSLIYHLNKKGINTTVTKSFPTLNDLEGVPAIFVTAGFENDPKITSYESDLLLKYMDRGGKLYFESRPANWLPQMRLPVMENLGAGIIKEPIFTIDSLLSNRNVFSDGKLDLITNSLKYSLVKAVPDNTAISFLFSASSPSCAVQWGNQTDSSNTIGSFVAFGQLKDRNDMNLKEQLADKYIEQFELYSGNLNPLFHTFTNLICIDQPVSFKDDSFDNIVFRNWHFPGGDPEYSDEADPSVTYKNSGVFDVRLTISDGFDTLSLNRKGYIEVMNCIWNSENEDGEIRVFPNPSSGIYSLILPDSYLLNHLQMEIYDMNGHKIYSEEVPNASKSLLIDLGEYPAGIYLLTITRNSGHFIYKLVKH